jgi:hypothetical protein
VTDVTSVYIGRAVLRFGLLMRGVQLLQAVLTLTLGYASYQRFWLGALAGCLAVGWAAWLAVRKWPAGGLPPLVAAADPVIAVAVLVIAAAAVPAAQLTTSFYWAGPLAQTVLLMAGLSLRTWGSLGAVAVVVTAYGIVIAAVAGAGALPVAGGIAVGMLAYYGLGVAVAHYARRLNRTLMRAAQRADQHEARLGVLAARAEELGRLHDDAMQVLERVAVADEPGSAELRAYAAWAAGRLRNAIDDQSPTGQSLLEAVSTAAAGFAPLGFLVEVTGELSGGSTPAVPACSLLTAATIEALNNSCKHSGVNEAAVAVTQRPGALAVTVTDDGQGFDPESVRRGFGLTNSIFGRLEDAGGGATLTTAPGAGTTIQMWLPC